MGRAKTESAVVDHGNNFMRVRFTESYMDIWGAGTKALLEERVTQMLLSEMKIVPAIRAFFEEVGPAWGLEFSDEFCD